MLTREQETKQTFRMIDELAANKCFDILIQIRKNLTASLPVAELIPEDQKVCERIDEILKNQ